MAQWPDVSFSHGFAARGRALAEKRLAHLTELYDSGRWARYYDKPGFLSDVREAKAAVEAWRRLEPASGQALPMVSQSSPALLVRDTQADEDYITTDPGFADRSGEPVGVAQTGQFELAEATSAEFAFDDDVSVAPGQAEPHFFDGDANWPRRSRLPPIAFSTHGVGTERDLGEA